MIVQFGNNILENHLIAFENMFCHLLWHLRKNLFPPLSLYFFNTESLDSVVHKVQPSFDFLLIFVIQLPIEWSHLLHQLTRLSTLSSAFNKCSLNALLCIVLDVGVEAVNRKEKLPAIWYLWRKEPMSNLVTVTRTMTESDRV